MKIEIKFSKLQSWANEDVRKLFARTFSDSEGKAEGALIGDLVFEILTKTAQNDFCGYVASKEEKIVGSIIFSKLYFDSEANVVLLSPVAISTDFQGKGIGQELINFGLSALRETGIETVITYGDPDFYSKVGFGVITEEVVKAPWKLTQPQGWLGQSLVSDAIEPIAGHSRCIEAFNKPELW